ncbi:MAG: nucleotidyltransferase family protein [Gorillibacterium sp.]|nr:nucleotidyltransferase family protein [Gorillibacterium sp.]
MLETNLETKLKQFLLENDVIMSDLRLVRSLDLPQCYLAAGYIRNYIWDRLHGYDHRSTHNDIDLVYYDREEASEERDLRLEQVLIEQTGNDKWSVKNQARMHIHKATAPYESTKDALSRWPEVVTAIGVALNRQDEIEICAPYGLVDLFNLIVRQSPLFGDRATYLGRIHKKEWQSQWPLLTIIEGQPS